jgi:formylglycine-generating enzyme required for sulfatase activity
MRPTILLALAVALCAACSDEPPQDATPAEPTWLTDRPESAHDYADETLARFGKLVVGDVWRDAAWNAQGTLEAVHEKTGLVFVLVPAGEFLMGSPTTEPGRGDDETLHRVTVPAFLLCKTECTQEAWTRGGRVHISRFKGSNLPVENVYLNDDIRPWCEELELRLPSESEWEHACRAGSARAYCFGDDASRLPEFGWYFVNSGIRTLPTRNSRDMKRVKGEWGCRTHSAGEKEPNTWGLCDMHGNVWEWTEDWYEESYDNTTRDGSAHADNGSGLRVTRGGSWLNSADSCRSAMRGRCFPAFPSETIGFRPAADLPE